MSSQEIEELINEEKSELFLSPRKTAEKMKEFVSNEKDMKQKISELEERLKSAENKLNDFQKVADEQVNQKKMMEIYESKINDLLVKFEESQQKLTQQIKLSDNSQKIETLNQKVKLNEEKISQIIQDIQDSKQTIDKQMVSNEQSIQKVKNEFTQIQAVLKKQQKQEKSTVDCQQGVFKYLFDKYNANPATNGIVTITGICDKSQNELFPKIIDSSWTENNWVSKDIENSFIKFEFKNILVKIEKYHLLLGWTNGNAVFRSWILTGVTEDNRNVVLHEINNSNDVTEEHPETTILICNQPFVKSIQITMKGRRLIGSKPQNYQMCVRNIEFYGKIKQMIE